MISPTFPNMLAVTSQRDKHGDSLCGALMVKSEALPVVGSRDHRHQYGPIDTSSGSNDGDQKGFRLKSVSYFVGSSEIPYNGTEGGKHRNAHLPNMPVHDSLNDQAGSIISAAWAEVTKSSSSTQSKRRGSLRCQRGGSCEDDGSSSGSSSRKRESLVVLDLQKIDGSLLKSEITVSQHSDDAVIAVVRDVTERYLRFDAERRVHMEALARQKDAQAVNRFTRHEIKNGLLAGIEMCQEASKRVDLIKTNTTIPIERLDEFDATKCLTDLDTCLHEMLDTVLAEAMAREVIHESYRPKLDRVDVYEALSQGVGTLDGVKSARFSLQVCPPDMPCLSMDPQLLKCIHRNAVSNACKYGKDGGKVTTEVHFFEKKGEFEMDICNEPGPCNVELIQMGEAANDIVFSQGTRLEVHSSNDDKIMNQVSSGDGAWIMQKCAKTMGGICTIQFDPHQTVFSFRCKVEADKQPLQANKEFQVPPGTWGLAFDDTSIQRKLMLRVMKYSGVHESNIIVKGSAASDIHELDGLMVKILSHDKTSKLLVFMDESLDYHFDGVSQRLSGSRFAERALGRLTPEQEARTLVLVRSANDSDDDIAIYKQRTHGFFPKASVHKERVRELLALAWFARFPDVEAGVPETVTDALSLDVSEIDDSSVTGYVKRSWDSDSTLRIDLLASIHKADSVAEQELDKDWVTIWSALHALKGDLLAMDDNDVVAECISMLSELRGGDQPKHFHDVWARIRERLLKEIQEPTGANSLH